MALSIQPVVTQRDLKRFVTFPWRIYRDDPNWVPPLIAGQMDKLTPGRNPFWEHAERALWLATEGGQPVGTIAAIVDHAQNRALGQAIGSFGFFECVNDPAAARLLLDTAADWLAARGMTVMCGPYNPGGNDEPGLLVEGYAHTAGPDGRPHPALLHCDLVEAAGFHKQWDTVAWLSIFPPQARRVEDVIPPKLLRTAQWAASRSQARLAPGRSFPLGGRGRRRLSDLQCGVGASAQPGAFPGSGVSAHVRFVQAAGRSSVGVFRRGER